ncbi:hypothetical protein JZ751_016219 [Albula glossodonta]|uniref:Uncharacterized protein n=1 Tax=Albula glossodonta TaxID=121402 RepID=A0A8T2MTI3_9TELE|nr:hypothetical protein JZ751_024089 [Albula glossodonta]KAG9332032.1 hypothetical protein JZ751_016219 [Albula glossodonta]
MPARSLMPLEYIADVCLYSPWNCSIDSSVAFGIMQGCIEPHNRQFYNLETTETPLYRHLPPAWNTMRRVDYQEIPWIMISPVIENQPVWNYFRDPANMGRIAQIAQNRIICPYIVPDNANRNHFAPAPFPALTLALSLILLIARVRATVHLAACLGFDAESRDLRSPQDRLKCEQQYAYTLDGSRMTTHDMPIAPQDIDVWNNFRQVVNQF